MVNQFELDISSIRDEARAQIEDAAASVIDRAQVAAEFTQHARVPLTEKDKMNDHRFANAGHGAHAISTAEIKRRIAEMFADSSEPDAVESTPR